MKVKQIKIPIRPDGTTNWPITITRGKLQDLNRDDGSPRGPLVGASVLVKMLARIREAAPLANEYLDLEKRIIPVSIELCSVLKKIKDLNEQLAFLESRKSQLDAMSDDMIKRRQGLRDKMDRLGFRTGDEVESGYDANFTPWYVSIGCKRLAYPKAVVFIKRLMKMLKESRHSK